MIEKKNIDRLFQEKFKDFNNTPHPELWERIEDELHPEKKKRRVIPIWWRIGGIAAGLLLLISLGITFFDSNDNPIKEDTIVDSDNIDINNNTESNSLVKTDSEAVQTNSSASGLNKIKQFSKLNTNSTPKQALVINDNIDLDKSNTPKANPFLNLKLSKKEFAFNFEPSIYSPSIIKIDKEDIDFESKEEVENDILNEEKTNAISEYVASLDKETNEDKENSKKGPRWSIQPNVAPVVFNSLGNGSTIGSDFNTNAKSSDINISYGITGSYAINNRLNIRTGVSKVNLGFDTNDVVLFNSTTSLFEASNRTFSTSALRNVSLNNRAGNTTVLSSAQLQTPNTLIISDQNNPNGSIEQRFGFIEVPLELEYAVVDKKIGVNVIGGFSALFLDNNEVFSNSNGQTTLIGEANNINNMSFSANFGLGVNYNFSKAINFNIEPTFKYQVNTFENTTGNFQPFFFGVYSGFQFKF